MINIYAGESENLIWNQLQSSIGLELVNSTMIFDWLPWRFPVRDGNLTWRSNRGGLKSHSSTLSTLETATIITKRPVRVPGDQLWFPYAFRISSGL